MSSIDAVDEGSVVGQPSSDGFHPTRSSNVRDDEAAKPAALPLHLGQVVQTSSNARYRQDLQLGAVLTPVGEAAYDRIVSRRRSSSGVSDEKGRKEEMIVGGQN